MSLPCMNSCLDNRARECWEIPDKNLGKTLGKTTFQIINGDLLSPVRLSRKRDERESATRHSVLLTTRTFTIQIRSSYTAVGVIVTLSTNVEKDAQDVKDERSRVISDAASM